MRHSGEAALPHYLPEQWVIGFVNEHVCLRVEHGIYAFWICGHFRKSDIDELTYMAVGDVGLGEIYTTIVFTEQITGHDPDLRGVLSQPGELQRMRAEESIVVTSNPIERMIVSTMALAARAVGNPGGAIRAVRTFDDALTRARVIVGGRMAASA